MALSQNCRQQRDREQALTQRWIRWGVLGAVGLHGGLLPLVGAATDTILSQAETTPIQILVAAPDGDATLAESPTPPLAAASSTARRSAGSPRVPAAAPEGGPAVEPEAVEPEPKATNPEPEPEVVEPEPVATDSEPEPEAVEPEPVATEPEAEPEVSEAPEVAETVEATPTSEPAPSPEPIAASPGGESGGESGTAPVALAAASESEEPATVGTGEIPEPSTSAGATAGASGAAAGLGRLLDGYFPDGEAAEAVADGEAETIARGSGLGDRGPSNEAQPNPGQGRGNGRRTISCRSCDRPSYPTAALEAGIEGEPKVAVQFDANGTVVGVVLEQSSGNAALDQAALAAAQRWRFDTGGQGGSVSVAIPFVIEGSDRHREAQRQGDRESATLPDTDTDTTARQAPGDRDAAPVLNSGSEGEAIAPRDRATSPSGATSEGEATTPDDERTPAEAVETGTPEPAETTPSPAPAADPAPGDADDEPAPSPPDLVPDPPSNPAPSPASDEAEAAEAAEAEAKAED
jgi:TonB family protein